MGITLLKGRGRANPISEGMDKETASALQYSNGLGTALFICIHCIVLWTKTVQAGQFYVENRKKNPWGRLQKQNPFLWKDL